MIWPNFKFATSSWHVELGVLSWRLDADNYETDEELRKIREDRGYSYMVCHSNSQWLCIYSYLVCERNNFPLPYSSILKIRFSYGCFCFRPFSDVKYHIIESWYLKIFFLILYCEPPNHVFVHCGNESTLEPFFRTFARFAQKNCQIMKRRSKTFSKNIFIRMKRSATVWQEVVRLVWYSVAGTTYLSVWYWGFSFWYRLLWCQGP